MNTEISNATNDQKQVMELLSGKLNFETLDAKSREAIINEVSMLHKDLVKQNEELKNINASLEILEQSYRAMFLEAPVPYVIIDDSSRIIHENRTFKRAYRKQGFAFQYLSQLISPTSKETFDWIIRQASAQDDPIAAQLELVIKDISTRVQIYLNRQLDQSLSFRLSIIDITDAYNAMQQMEFFSFHDMLTETYNRYYLETEYRRINVRRCHPIGLIMADINSLRKVNDAYGHEYGDVILKDLAKRLKDVCRQEDIVVRLGGDEFAILIPNISQSNIELLTGRLTEATIGLSIRDAHLTTAFGYALHSDITITLEQLMHQAETHLNNQKQLKQGMHDD